MNSMKLVLPSHFISWINSFSDISRKWVLPNMIRAVNWKKTPSNAVTPQCQSQFTSKMKANAVPRLLSSLVWTDQYNECNGITSFMEFMSKYSVGIHFNCWLWNSISVYDCSQQCVCQKFYWSLKPIKYSTRPETLRPDSAIDGAVIVWKKSSKTGAQGGCALTS